MLDFLKKNSRPHSHKSSPVFNLFVSGFVLVTLSGCASLLHKTEKTDAIGQVIRESDQDLVTINPPSSGNSSSSLRSSNAPLEVWGRKLENSHFDYPVIVNPRVEHWITYFTGKGRKYFEKYLERGRYFIPEISKVLKTHNMPQDLVYLAMIESGFHNSAKSRARAVGPWQFIRQTGMRYGLTVDFWLDERRDTRKSTLASMAYLKELYKEFNSWELAAAGYNAGENKVRRAIKKYKTNDFWEIANHRFFKRETRDYVPKIMAAAIITKNPEMFGFEDVFKKGGLVNPTVLASVKSESTGLGEEPTPKELGEPDANPKEEVAEDTVEKENLEKDANDDDVEISADDEDDNEDSAVVSQTPHSTMTPSVYMVANPNEQILEFEIKGPADLFAISKAAALPYSTIKLLNPELTRWCTPPYLKTYKIKLPLSTKDRFLSTYNDQSFDRRVVFLQHRVRKGDSLNSIAKHYRTELTAIRELNKIPTSVGFVPVGRSLQLPLPTGYKRVIAGIYDDKPLPPLRKKHRRYRRGVTRKISHKSASRAYHHRLRPNIVISKD